MHQKRLVTYYYKKISIEETVVYFSALIAFGVKEFNYVNKICTVINIIIIILIIIAGLTVANFDNWNWTPEEIYKETFG